MLLAIGAAEFDPPRAVTSPPVELPQPRPEDLRESRALAEKVLAAHNQMRDRERLAPLVLDPKLSSAAVAHARDMASHQEMRHAGSDGSTPLERLHRTGYKDRTSAENVAHGYDSVEAVMQGWLNSPPHRKNILGAYEQMGFGVARDEDGRPYWCAEFATPWPVVSPTEAAESLVEALNAPRKAKGKAPLKAHPVLEREASRLAERMAKEQSFAALTDSTRNLPEILGRDRVRYRRLAQAAASGQPRASDVVARWMADPAHRDNVLGNYDHVGVGYASASNGTPYWFVILAESGRQ